MLLICKKKYCLDLFLKEIRNTQCYGGFSIATKVEQPPWVWSLSFSHAPNSKRFYRLVNTPTFHGIMSKTLTNHRSFELLKGLFLVWSLCLGIHRGHSSKIHTFHDWIIRIFSAWESYNGPARQGFSCLANHSRANPCLHLWEGMWMDLECSWLCHVCRIENLNKITRLLDRLLLIDQSFIRISD